MNIFSHRIVTVYIFRLKRIHIFNRYLRFWLYIEFHFFFAASSLSLCASFRPLHVVFCTIFTLIFSVFPACRHICSCAHESQTASTSIHFHCLNCVYASARKTKMKRSVIGMANKHSMCNWQVWLDLNYLVLTMHSVCTL